MTQKILFVVIIPTELAGIRQNLQIPVVNVAARRLAPTHFLPRRRTYSCGSACCGQLVVAAEVYVSAPLPWDRSPTTRLHVGAFMSRWLLLGYPTLRPQCLEA